MQWSLFPLILMGQCLFVMCRLYEYHFIEDKFNWTAARNYCRSHYTDLATAYNEADVTEMKKLNKYEAWIGLYNTLWSQPGVEFSGSETTVEHEDDMVKNCVFIENSVKKKSDKCNEKKKFICCKEGCSSSKNEMCQMVDEEKSWKDAQSHCRDKGMDLVSGEAQIKQDISLSRGENVWIGLFRETWKWSDGSSFNFRNWDQQNPAGGECALIGSEKWKSNDCKETKPFICYEDKIKLIKQNKTWQEAMDYCREHHNDLISITDVHQQRWVQERAKNAQTEFIWLGLRYTCTLDMWFWVIGEDFIYDNWESCPPTQGCYSGAAMKTDEGYKWVTRRDNETFNFICTL